MAAAESTSPSLTSSQVAPKQYVLAGGTTLLNTDAAAIWEQALAKASVHIVELLSRADRDTLLNEVFGRAGTEATTFEANKQALLEAIGTTGLRIAIDLRSSTEMGGAIGAYAQVGPNGHEMIYINADWINAGNLSPEQLTAVVLEEYGHALDVRLNPGLECAGDEGELFANLITNAGLNADQIAAINTQNDWGTVQVDGQTVVVEQADVTITWTGTTSNVLNVSSNYNIPAGFTVGSDGNPSALFIFGNNAASRYSLTNSTEFKANSFEFTGTNSYTIANSGPFNFIGSGTGITQSSSANQTISGGIKVSDGPFTLGGNGTGLVTLSGTSNDYASKGLSKTGTSAFLLSSGNVLSTGTVTINAGTLALSSTTSLSGLIQLRGGVIATSGSFARTLGTSTASVNFGAGGGGFAAYGGALTVSTNLGTWASTTNGLAVSTPLILGSSIANNVVTLSAGLNLGAAARTIQLVDNTTTANDAAVMSGIISGTGGGLTVTGSGTLTLSGTNTYTGVTTLSGGVLSVATIGNGGVAGNLGSAANAANRLVFDGGTLRYTGTTASTDRNFTLNAGKTGTLDVNSAGTNLTMTGASTATTGSFTKAGAGTLTLTGANTYTGGTTISAGTLSIGSGSTTGSIAGNVANSGTLHFNRSNALNYAGIVSGTGAVTKSGAGTLTLTGANTYTGGTTISAGTLSIGSGSTSGSIAGNVANSGTLVFNRSDALTYAGVVSGTGAVTKSGAGTLTLTGANTYSGGTTLSAGTLNVSGAAGALTATSGVNISGGTLLLSGSAADRISNGASISLGGATDTKLQLSGAVTETLGSLTLSSGSGFRVIDFGSTSGVLTLASLTAEIALGLQIWNWSGTTGTGGGTDQLIISSGSLGGELSTSNIKFYSDSGTTLLSSAGVFDANSDELVPVDTTPPATPSITSVTDDVSPLTGTVASGGSTNDTVLVIAGTAEANSTVTVYNGSTSLGTTSADGSGAWTFTTATLFNGSTYSFTATATDAAGNVSADSANYTVTVDTAAPTLLSSTPADGATDAGVSNNLVLNFSETIAAGSGLISLYRANGSLVESFDAATGVGSAGGSVAFSGSAVTINFFADLVRGSAYYLQVAATAVRDSAGNLYAGISDATTLNFTTAAVTVSVGSITVSESSLYAVVAVGLDAAISDNLSFTPTLLSGTASIGSDAGSTLQVFNGASWVSAAAGVSLAAGSTSLLLRVAINNDTTLEGLETFQISTGAISAGAAALNNAAGASGMVTIADDGSSAHIFDQDTNSATPLLRSTDNDTPSIAVSSVIVSEASPYAVLEVSLTNPSNFAVSFTPSLQGGSASIGVDIGSSLEVFNGSTWEVVGAGQISLAAGVTSRLVRVAIANDGSYENSEAFTISTGAISGLIANPAGASGTVTIRDNGSSSNTFLANNNSATPTAGSADNDTPILPALSAAVLSNGNESGTVATNFRISRTNTTGDLVVTYRFGGNAIASSDYTNPADFDVTTGLDTVTILAGQSSVDLSVPTIDDSAVDGNRSLSLLLQSSLTYTIAAATATILDNDVAPPLTSTFAISSASVVETDLGSNPIVNLIVSLSAPSSTSVSVRVRTLAASSGSSATGITASGGGDYVAFSDQLLIFLPGSTSQLLPIQLLGDNTIEATESFRIELFDANGANLPAAAATIEIVDNDSGKSLTINNSAATTSQTFSGGQYADILIGGSAADTINGDPAGQIGGGDAITGNGGADILTGGAGPDRFRYLSFSDSTLNSTDRIRDLTLTGSDQDRIALAALPSALWNTGAITPGSPTLASAVTAAFADKDGLTAGNQALAAGEAVLFAYDSTPGNSRTRQWFVAVNDSSAAFSSSNDLLINVTGLSSSFASGSLTPSLLFATL